MVERSGMPAAAPAIGDRRYIVPSPVRSAAWSEFLDMSGGDLRPGAVAKDHLESRLEPLRLCAGDAWDARHHPCGDARLTRLVAQTPPFRALVSSHCCGSLRGLRHVTHVQLGADRPNEDGRGRKRGRSILCRTELRRPNSSDSADAGLSASACR